MGGWSRAAFCGMLVVFLLLPFCFRGEGGTVHHFVVCWLFVLFLQFVFRWAGGLVHHCVEFWLCLLLLPFVGGGDGGLVYHFVEFGLFLCLCPLNNKRGGWYRASCCGFLVVLSCC